MEFMFLLYTGEKRWSAMTEGEAQREYGAYLAYTKALREAGVYVGGSPLQPTTTATSVHAVSSR